jgi:hypothetical protein
MDECQGKVCSSGNDNEHGKEDVVAHLLLADRSKVKVTQSCFSRFLNRDFQY